MALIKLKLATDMKISYTNKVLSAMNVPAFLWVRTQNTLLECKYLLYTQVRT